MRAYLWKDGVTLMQYLDWVESFRCRLRLNSGIRYHFDHEDHHADCFRIS